MTRKQQTLVLHRTRDVFSSSELHRIHTFVDAVATEDIMGRPQVEKLKFDFHDKRIFINAVINAELFRHGVMVSARLTLSRRSTRLS